MDIRKVLKHDFKIILFLSSLFIGQAAFAYTCSDIDGAWVRSSKDGGTYLGFFGNELAGNSVNNLMGAYGDELSTSSVRNAIEDFGGASSQYSHDNTLAQNPPEIYKHGTFVGYVTTNPSKTPGLSLGDIDAACSFASGVEFGVPAALESLDASQGKYSNAIELSYSPGVGTTSVAISLCAEASCSSPIYLGETGLNPVAITGLSEVLEVRLGSALVPNYADGIENFDFTLSYSADELGVVEASQVEIPDALAVTNASVVGEIAVAATYFPTARDAESVLMRLTFTRPEGVETSTVQLANVLVGTSNLPSSSYEFSKTTVTTDTSGPEVLILQGGYFGHITNISEFISENDLSLPTTYYLSVSPKNLRGLGNGSVVSGFTGTAPDTVVPVISLVGDANVAHVLGTTYSDAGAIAVDDVDGDISSSITVSGTVNTAIPGTYTITYSVTDAASNVATQVMRAVTVDIDTDGDGTGNNADTDDDGDGVLDTVDAFPLDATETLDTDADGTGNNADTDDDGDGVADGLDAFPLDATETLDIDADGIGDNVDTDDDNDGVLDSDDALPLDATESIDTDADGTGNNADTDDDNDDVLDSEDAFPLDATETLDTDGDGIGNNADADDDGDGVSDEEEVADGTDPLDSADFILLSGVVLDWKNQLPIADVIVTAVSGDNGLFSAEASGDPLGRYAFVDKYVGKNNLTFSKTTSSERLRRAISSLDALAALKMAIGINPNRDPDGDGPEEALSVSDYQRIAADMNADGKLNSRDALEIIKAAVGLADIAPRWVFVPEDHALSFEAGIDLLQFDSIEVDYPATKKVNMIGILLGDVDGSWEGPVVTDADGDGFFSFEDAFPDDPSEWLDTDGDGIGNNVDTDDDGDGVADANDGFPQISTGSLTDTDADGLPDDCDTTCQATGLTADLDDDGDNVLDVNDALPLISLAGNLDTDQDGLPDECDTACLDLGLIADTDDDGDGALDYEDPFPLDADVSVGRKAPSNLGLIE